MVEKDPYGKNAQDPGAKLDHGKPLAGLVLGGFSKALYEVVKVGTYGARKYSLGGWKEVPFGEHRFYDALWRHLLNEETEGKMDEETGLLHMAQVAWNALAILEFRLRRKDGEEKKG